MNRLTCLLYRPAASRRGAGLGMQRRHRGASGQQRVARPHEKFLIPFWEVVHGLAPGRMFLVALSIATVTYLSACPYAAAEDAKLHAFISQYRALRVEGVSLWQAVQRADLTQDARLLSLQGDILNFTKRNAALGHGIEEHRIQRGRESLARGVEPPNDSDYTLVARAAYAMLTLLDSASTYLDTKQALYLRVALEYERAWKILDDQVRRGP